MIRNATIDDIETIIEFNQHIARETEEFELNRGNLRQGVKAALTDGSKGTYFVYEKDGQIVGQMMITNEWSDWRNGYFWWIQSVYVHQSYRRQGIFHALYEHVKDLAAMDSMICGIRLYVERENLIAQSTYKKQEMEESDYLLYEWKK